MSLKTDIKFQKLLAQAAAANPHEAAAAERAARKFMTQHAIDPVTIPDRALTSHLNFAANPLLTKLREEWRAQHPDYHYTSRGGFVRRLKHKPRPRKPRPGDYVTPEDLAQLNKLGLFDDFLKSFDTPDTTPEAPERSETEEPGAMYAGFLKGIDEALKTKARRKPVPVMDQVVRAERPYEQVLTLGERLTPAQRAKIIKLWSAR
jgi:hypothetical protein